MPSALARWRSFNQLGWKAYGTPQPLFLHERCVDATDLNAMAAKWSDEGRTPVTPEDLGDYIPIKRYIHATAHGDYEGQPAPDDIARARGMSEADVALFVEYYHMQVRAIHDAEADEEVVLVPPWKDAIGEEFDIDFVNEVENE